MTKEVLQKNLEKELKRKNIFFTRLRTPNTRYRGVRYPADFVVWGERAVYLIECKQRKNLPIRPSDIRQLPFMVSWSNLAYSPKALYLVLTSTEEGLSIFTYKEVVSHSESHKGLKIEDSIIHTESMKELVEKLLGLGV